MKELKLIEGSWPRLLTKTGSKPRLKKRSCAKRRSKWSADKDCSTIAEADCIQPSFTVLKREWDLSTTVVGTSILSKREHSSTSVVTKLKCKPTT